MSFRLEESGLQSGFALAFFVLCLLASFLCSCASSDSQGAIGMQASSTHQLIRMEFLVVRFDERLRDEDVFPYVELKISKNKVSRRQWRSVMGTEPWRFHGKEMSLPPGKRGAESAAAAGLSWLDAELFCRKLSALRGSVCRLPTDREWKAISQNEESRSAINRTSSGKVIGMSEGLLELCTPDNSTCAQVRDGFSHAVVVGGGGPGVESLRGQVGESTRSSRYGFRVLEETNLFPRKITARRVDGSGGRKE